MSQQKRNLRPPDGEEWRRAIKAGTPIAPVSSAGKESRRARDQKKEEAARAKQTERRARLLGRAQEILQIATEKHDAVLARISQQRTELERQEELEQRRWAKDLKKLSEAVQAV